MKIIWAVGFFLLLFHQNAMAFSYLCKVEDSNAIPASILWEYEISDDHSRITYTQFINTAVPESTRYNIPETVLFSDEKQAVTINDIYPYGDDRLFVRLKRFDFEKDVMMATFAFDAETREFAFFKCKRQ